MSDLLANDLADWLAAQASLAVGTDLFVGHLPQDGSLATVVRETGGPGGEYVPVADYTFQLTTRGADYAEARARAAALYDCVYPPGARVPVRNANLSADWRALAIDAAQPPADLGRGEDGRHRVVFNLIVRAHRLSGGE